MAIINPWIFYLIDILSKISFLSILLAIILILALFTLVIFRNEGCNDKKLCNKWISISSTALVVCFVLTVLIPSKETIYTMLVTNYVTYDNVEIATDTIKDSVDYIFDKFDEDKE